MNRKLETCFINGQKIRHKISDNTWTGVYDGKLNSILYNGIYYSLNQFTGNHYKQVRPDRTYKNNAWNECECEIDNGSWIDTFNLPFIDQKVK